MMETFAPTLSSCLSLKIMLNRHPDLNQVTIRPLPGLTKSLNKAIVSVSSLRGLCSKKKWTYQVAHVGRDTIRIRTPKLFSGFFDIRLTEYSIDIYPLPLCGIHFSTPITDLAGFLFKLYRFNDQYQVYARAQRFPLTNGIVIIR